MEATVLPERQMYGKIDPGKTGFFKYLEYGQWLDTNNYYSSEKNHFAFWWKYIDSVRCYCHYTET